MNTYAVILNWRRPENVRHIVHSLAGTGLFNRVFIRDQSGGQLDGAGLISSTPHPTTVFAHQDNRYVYGRYETIENGPDGIYCVCDDDVDVYCWEKLLSLHQKTGRLVTAMPQRHIDYYNGLTVDMPDGKPIVESLIGWGAVMSHEWAVEFVKIAEQKMLESPSDRELIMRKADRLFTMLCDPPPVIVEAEFTALDGHSGPEALWRRKDHWRMNDAARVLARQWRAEGLKIEAEAT